MQLDEIREQYKLIVRSTNSRAQARRVEFMEHNLEALNAVQKQVSLVSYDSQSEVYNVELTLSSW